MARLLIVSNRLPVSITKKAGKLEIRRSVGGLATGLSSFYKTYESIWIGWPGTTLKEKKEEKAIKKELVKEGCYPVFLSKREVENYYFGFSNKTVWPLFHYFPMYTSYKNSFWESYKAVNEAFCDAIVKIAKPNDAIWIHDYHLMLLPSLLREKLPKATIGFFLHIPFPSFEVFRLFPQRRKILRGLLGADLIGFHMYDYAQYFLDSVRRLLGYEHVFGQITKEDRVITVDAFPMGIDYEKFSTAANDAKVHKEIKKIRKKLGDRKIILSVDRLDYTKGIPQRLEAFDHFLEKYPKYKKKVTLILVAVPSREGIENYMALKKQLDGLVGGVNGKHGTLGWSPVWYLYRCLDFSSLVALYKIADIALVTPLRDGMNLVAKEFIATKTNAKGVLILSEMAGAVNELWESVVINANNKEEMVDAIKEALDMPEEEQIRRNKVMQKRLSRYNVTRWAHEFMDKLSNVKKVQQNLCVKMLTDAVRKKFIKEYSRSKKRLILLDYDGTLVQFAERPEEAKPDKELFRLFEALAKQKKNELVIISGRDKETLEKWFGHLDVGLIAEHGVWLKEKGGSWEMIEPLSNEWKAKLRPILELYVDRTPGSFIEEKEFSLVWHYRNANPVLAKIRTKELKAAILHLTANLNLGILEGSKVVEIKNISVSKGRAALKWVAKQNWGFILAAGDDYTDEDTFSMLPETAYSVKVGLVPSKAKFNLNSVSELRVLLKDLGKAI